MTQKPLEPAARCCARIRRAGDPISYSGTLCLRRWTVTRDGKNYCGTHDPEAKKARDEKWRAKFDAEMADRRHGYEIEAQEAKVLAAGLAWHAAYRTHDGIADALEAFVAACDKLQTLKASR